MRQSSLYRQQIQSAMTVDVEDYFHVSAFDSQISRSQWGEKYPIRVERNTDRLLALFDKHQVKATFFMLGWVARSCPTLARRIVDNGHELASHGFAHQKANRQTPTEFKQDVYHSKVLLEDLIGAPVLGYRAPSFSIDPSNQWAFAILTELGFQYSSSTYPVKHDQYGAPTWPKTLYRRPEGIIEIPIPTFRLLGQNIPIGGGGFFRLYPYKLSKTLIERYISNTGMPYSFYFHPWEIDSNQPRVTNISAKSQFRHYLNIERMQSRIERLLQDFSWNTMSQAYQLTEFINNANTPSTNQTAERSAVSRVG